MSVLTRFKTYWSGNSTLQTAMPVSKVYLDFLPPSTAFPCCRFSYIPGGQPVYVTAETHIETVNYQLSVFNIDLDALVTLAGVIDGQLSKKTIDATTISHTRTTHHVMGEVVNGVYTYCYILCYEWVFNA